MSQGCLLTHWMFHWVHSWDHKSRVAFEFNVLFFGFFFETCVGNNALRYDTDRISHSIRLVQWYCWHVTSSLHCTHYTVKLWVRCILLTKKWFTESFGSISFWSWNDQISILIEKITLKVYQDVSYVNPINFVRRNVINFKTNMFLIQMLMWVYNVFNNGMNATM